MGDLLVPAPREEIVNYMPHAPERVLEGRIIDLANDAHETDAVYRHRRSQAQDGLKSAARSRSFILRR